MSFARTPSPPYVAVIFSAERTAADEGYGEAATQMRELAGRQPGYLGMESAGDGFEITVSYWDSLEAVARWREQPKHRQAQAAGKAAWYSAYYVRICEVTRDYRFETGATADA